ncbi:MAG TPA: hypothetical protein VNS63_18880 [Blastocatellia bacterium]|nr:hypothetical protein [Blastocatellia bacterium]
MFRSAIVGLTLIFLVSAVASAQVPSTGTTNTDQALAVAEQHLRKGEACLASGDAECARREFDSAVDYVFNLGVDTRSDERLRLGLRAMIEKINHYETGSGLAAAKPFWRTQEFEGRPLAESTDAVEALAGDSSGPLTVDGFQRKFAELRKRFNEKYARDITLTGADHSEHRRLYGAGSAYDIRVRDLTREQVAFIVATGARLGLRIKDFSTWDRVQAHNARTFALGRPLDTLATGIHLHIDRMTPAKAQAMASKPAVSSHLRKSDRSRNN